MAGEYVPSMGGQAIGAALQGMMDPKSAAQPPPSGTSKYRITGPDGSQYDITAPANATHEDVANMVRQHFSQAQPKDQETPRSAWEAAGRGALQGLTFNMSDEMYAGGMGALDSVTGGPGYASRLADVRKGNHEAENQHFGAYLGGQLGGSILPTVGTYLATAATGGAAAPAAAATTAATAANAAKLATLAGRMKTGMITGAKVGTLYGIGGAESDPDSTMVEAAGNRVLGGVKGAVGGAVVGGLIPPVADVAGAVVRPIVNLARAIRDPERQAASKLAEAFQRDYPKAGDKTVYGIAGSEKPQLFADNGSILADVGGESVKGKMRSALNTPNAERENFQKLLNERQKAQPGAIEDQLGKDLGNPSTYYQAADKIVADRSAKAGPAFADAWAGDMDPSKRLLSVFQRNGDGLYTRPTVARIVRDVENRLADEHGDALSWLANNPGRMLHEIKVELDDKIATAVRANKMGTASSADGYDLRSLMSLKNQLMQGIDESGGSFPQKYLGALRQYGTDSSLKSALRDGANEALTLQPEEIARKLKAMSPPEQEMYRLGASRALAEKNRMGKDTNDRIGRDWQSPDRNMRMQELLPDANKAGFDERMGALGLQAETRRAAQGNSTTAKQLKEMADDAKPAELIKQIGAAIKTPTSALIDAISQKANVLSGMTPQVAENTLRILSHNLSNKTPGASSVESILQDAIARREITSQRAQEVVNALSRGAVGTTADHRQNALARGGR
jgi:hypothetical protein